MEYSATTADVLNQYTNMVFHFHFFLFTEKGMFHDTVSKTEIMFKAWYLWQCGALYDSMEIAM